MSPDLPTSHAPMRLPDPSTPPWLGSLPLDVVPIGVALSQSGVYLQVNAAFLKIFGYEHESEILGKPLLDTIEARQRDLVRLRNEERERTGSGPAEYETVGLRKDGSTFPELLYVTVVPLAEGVGTLAFITEIFERKQVETRLRESELLFRTYVEQSIDIIFTLDAKGTLTFVSPAWEKHFGFPANEVLGRPFVPFVHPEDVEPCMQYLGRVLSTGHPETSPPYRVRHADGSWRRFVANGSCMASPGGAPLFLGVARDITEEHAAQAALMESEQQLHVIFEASDAGIILVSPRGQIQFANRRMAELLGMTVLDLIGTQYTDHLHESDKRVGDLRMHQIIAGEVQSTSHDRRYVRPDGTEFWGHLSGRRLENPDGTLRALVGVITDITDRRLAEEQQRLLQAELHQVQKMESLGSLAGGVAHDMNNVLGAILGLASAHIEAQLPGSPTHKAFATIIKAAVRGGNMLKSLLSFARQSSSDLRALDLNTILREEVRLLERTTLAKVHLVLDLAPDLWPIQGDASALTHGFMNLCVNAVDAMAENGTLTLRTRNHGPDWIEVQVEDTGLGMAKEVLERAMDPFFTTKEVGKGTGLGLSIVYRTVKAHQGELEIQSEPGRGTCVRIRFPASEADPGTGKTSRASETGHALASLKVLLVDDDELIQSSVQTILELLGHQATPALCGEEALALINRGLRPDLVILDMNMPGLGGAQTLPLLRALMPRVPVLLATGRADQVALNLVQAHPFVSMLAKPFGRRELQASLAPYVG
jgi:PAS domain S-box-containing protein